MKNGENQYWSSLEELENTPEFRESVQREFPAVSQETPFEVNRRDFLKLMSASLLMAGAACSRKQVEKIIPYVNKPEEIVLGLANYYASTCQECSASCGIVVKTREGRPIKLEGNTLHPVNQGALCARGQASILNLYSAGRFRVPQVRAATGVLSDATWVDLDKQVLDRLAAAKNIALITGVVNSPSTLKLIGDFAGRYSGFTHVSYDPTVPEEVALGANAAYGQKITPRYRLDKAKVLVSFGADFLGSYLSPVEFAKGFSRGRRVDEKKMSRFVAFEGQVTLTGTNADEYYALRSGDELQVILALANEIILQQKVSSYASDSNIAKILSGFSPDVVAGKVGVDVVKIKDLAKELIANKGAGLVLGSGVKSKDSVSIQIVANLINSALDNDGATIDWSLYPSYQANSSYSDLANLVEQMNAGKVDVVIIDHVDLAYLLPSTVEALKKVPFIISISEQADETTELAHVVAASHHYLENWNDSEAQRGVYGLAQPVITPLYDTRSLQDNLLQWSGSQQGWDVYLKSHWQSKIYPQVGSGTEFEFFWLDALQKGVIDTRLVKGNEPDRLAGARSFDSRALSQIKVTEASTDYSLSLYSSVAMSDGRSAGNPWLQELPDPVSKVVWDNYLAVSPKTAEDMRLKLGDIVRVSGAGYTFDAPALIQPKLNDRSVSIALGYGRKIVGASKQSFGYLGGDLGQIGQDTGVNVAPAQSIQEGYLNWGGLGVSLAKTGKKYQLAVTQGHHTLENRPIVADTTFKEFMVDAKAGHDAHAAEDLTMWTEHEYNGYKWGMAIDMTSCTGCNSCMIGCQVENNVSVVGKQQVINGRDMHWIRIDRYYKGDVANPDVAYQPMLCQHCDNAPCETVCPVLATMHNDEGINVMVYNRCVGTRYCANNCPYKVRRFNFFEYSEQMKSPLNMVLNPDMGTREQGVMEKCTFCWQRIREAKDVAKDQGRLVRDGDVRAACQQTCPSDAIVFGNLNDPQSRVTKLSTSQRGYHVLEFLNTKPQVTYLTKVRNKEEA